MLKYSGLRVMLLGLRFFSIKGFADLRECRIFALQT